MFDHTAARPMSALIVVRRRCRGTALRCIRGERTSAEPRRAAEVILALANDDFGKRLFGFEIVIDIALRRVARRKSEALGDALVEASGGEVSLPRQNVGANAWRPRGDEVGLLSTNAHTCAFGANGIANIGYRWARHRSILCSLFASRRCTLERVCAASAKTKSRSRPQGRFVPSAPLRVTDGGGRGERGRCRCAPPRTSRS